MKRARLFATTFIKTGLSLDVRTIRTRVALWLFNLIPDFFLLMPIRNAFLKMGGADIPLWTCYIRSPFYCGRLKNLKISSGVFINKGASFEANAPITIGPNCQIGPSVKIENTNHLVHENMRTEQFPVTVDEGVWIGSGVILLPKSHLQSRVVVAAGAVVSGVLNGHGCVFGGVPAKKIPRGTT